MVALPTVATQFILTLRSYLNPQGPTQTTLLNFDVPDSTTANASGSQPIIVPANTVGQAINFASMFPSLLLPLFVFIADITTPATAPGFNWYTHAAAGAGEKQPVGPNGFMCWGGATAAATGANPIYIDNPTNNELVLQVGCVSN